MGIALIFIGLFLGFTLAFNGGVGETFVNYAFFTSALFMIIAGSLRIALSISNGSSIICGIALFCYIPMIWQRFNYKFGTDWIGLCFDIAFVLFMLIFIFLGLNNKNKSVSGE